MLFWGCFFGGSGGNRSEDGRREGGVEVVWPVGWVLVAGAAKVVGDCDACKAGGGGRVLGL